MSTQYDVVLIIKTCVSAVAQLLLQALVGIFLVWTRALDGEKLAVLSHILFKVMVPVLLFDALCISLESASSLLTWWPLVAYSLVHVSLGMMLGWLLRMVVPHAPEFREGFVLATGLGNVGFLPYALSEALLTRPPFSDDPTAVVRAFAYIALYVFPFTIFCFSVGLIYITKKQHTVSPGEEIASDEESILEENLQAEVIDNVVPPHAHPTTLHGCRRLWFRFWHSKITKTIMQPPIVALLCGAVVGLVSPLRALLYPAAGSVADPPLSVVTRAIQSMAGGVSPLGLIILGARLVIRRPKDETVDGSKDAHVAVQDTVTVPKPSIPDGGVQLGKTNTQQPDDLSTERTIPGAVSEPFESTVSIPSIKNGTAVPENALQTPPRLPKRTSENRRDWITAVCIFIARMLIMPLLGWACLALGDAIGIIPADNIVFRYVLVLATCVPTAFNVLVLVEISQRGQFQLGKVFLLQYLMTPVTLSFWLVLFLQFAL